MFLSWNGYEIDGSDTDFDIVLPEAKELTRFVDCFLSIPLFSGSTPWLYYYSPKKNQQESLSPEEFKQWLLLGDRPTLFADVNCCVMDALPTSVQTRLCALSRRREPLEEAFGKVEHPCMSPLRQWKYTRGEMTVTLAVQPPGTKQNWYTEKDSAVTGYVYNEALMRSEVQDYPCISINVGPSFYYEYAIFIMEYLRDSFPGMAAAGGLDCQDGWTHGCTYACSIYSFERLLLPVRHSVRNTLKHLTDYDLFHSYRQYYKKSWHYDQLSDFRMVNNPEDAPEGEFCLPFSDYVSHVEGVLAQAGDAFSAVCDTAVHILLPRPSRFHGAPEAEKRLLDALAELEDPEDCSYYTCYAAFFPSADGSAVCEFRIPWQVKNYFLTLLELTDQGDLDYIKAETYAGRHSDDR